MKNILSAIGGNETAAVALIIKDKKILLGYRHYEEISTWVCPGGRSDEGEMIESTLRREVAEETGITDLVIKEYLGEFAGANLGHPVFAFLCDSDQKEQLIEPEKFSEWKWFSKEELESIAISDNTKKLIINLL
jgi:8-oxo-dGTP pyrophosphatase MutT (NUDIX family)